ncbi:MAG: TolB family protein [Bacteroidota bacterium]
MRKEILVAALIFLSISSCKKAENPVSPNWELSGKIVYSTGTSIYLLDLSGSNPVPRLLVDEAGEPVVSPDGKTVAFSKISPAGSFDIYRINVDGTDMVNLTNRSWIMEGQLDWSPDGNWIVFTGDYPPYERLYIMDRDGRNIHPITDTSYYAAAPSWGLPGFSPVGRNAIAFLWRPFATSDVKKRRLRLISPEGSMMTDLDQMNDGPASWSPDSRFILYPNERGYFVAKVSTLARYPLETDSLEFAGSVPHWASDGSLFAIERLRGTNDYGLYRITLGSERVVSIQKILAGLFWGVTVVSPDDRYIGIFGRRQEGEGVSLYVYDTINSSLIKVAELSPPTAPWHMDSYHVYWIR